MIGSKTNQSILAICLVLAALTLALYWPMTGHKFVSLDDHDYITENPHVTEGLTASGVIWAFTTGHASNWHPLTWISHQIDCSLYALNPGGHHLTNLLFHIADTMLLFVLLHQMTGSIWRSAFVAALFAWHPLHVESVAWASERKDVLSTFFWILTMMAYVRYADESKVQSPAVAQKLWRGEPRSKVFYGLALLLFAFGLMSKPMLVTLPFVLLLIDFWPLARLRRRGVVIEKLPFFALAIVASVVTYLVQAGAASSLKALPVHVRMENALLAYVRYIANTFWPVDLAAIYPYARILPVGAAAVSALLLAGLTGWMVQRSKRQPWMIVGWLWFLGTLVPTIGLVQVGSQSMADRYMYIPSIGFFITIVWTLNEVVRNWPHGQKAMAATGAVALAACMAVTHVQLAYWHDSISLFNRAIEVTENNYIAYNGLGGALDEAGAKDTAMTNYLKSVAIDPHYAEAQYNIATALMDQGKLDEAVIRLNAAVADNPKYAPAHNNLGKALMMEGKLDEAIQHISKAVALTPDFPEAHYNLGTLLLRQSRADEAIAQFTETLRLKPDHADAHSNLGVALMQRGQFAAGTAHLAEAVRLNPSAENHLNLGLALFQQNRPADALPQFSESIRLAPNNAAAHYQLGSALARLRQTTNAVAQYREAIRLNPGHADALNALARILATSPDPALRDGQEAVRLAEQARDLTNRQQPAMLTTLSAAYAEAGRFPDAVATAQKALDLATANGQKPVVAEAGTFLKLFQSGQPFRELF